MDILLNYKNIEETTETLFSFLIHNKKGEDIIKYLNDQLDKAKNISNPIKKHKINNRLFLLNKYIQEVVILNPEQYINSIFLIQDKVIEYKLNNNEIKIALKYNILNIFQKIDNKFCIEYFIDIFNNFEFIYAFRLNKNELIIKELNKNKELEINKINISNEIKIVEEIENLRKTYKDLIIIYGNSSFLNKLDNTNKNIIIVKEYISKENIYHLYEIEIMKKNHLLLEKRLNDMKNEKTNIDLYIFGKLKLEIKESIESYLIKELYIEDKKLEKLKTFIDESLLNFKIIIIKSLENGDIADNFIKDYNGIMAIKYY